MNVFTAVVWVFYFVILTVCLLEALFPKWCWKTFESWKATKEPPKAYFLRKRVEGIIGAIVITAIALAPILVAYLNN